MVSPVPMASRCTTSKPAAARSWCCATAGRSPGIPGVISCPALAEAGFRVVAPDQRGYGQTDKPEAIEAYNILNLVSDIVGLVNSLGQERAVIVGHDWGAPVAWTSALIRTDMFRGLGLLSVPYMPRSPVPPAEYFKAITQHKNFYQDYFQEPGKVEKELEADVHRTMLERPLFRLRRRSRRRSFQVSVREESALRRYFCDPRNSFRPGSPSRTLRSSPMSSSRPDFAAVSTGIATSSATGRSLPSSMARG